jgi:hypothetical protein
MYDEYHYALIFATRVHLTSLLEMSTNSVSDTASVRTAIWRGDDSEKATATSTGQDQPLTVATSDVQSKPKTTNSFMSRQTWVTNRGANYARRGSLPSRRLVVTPVFPDPMEISSKYAGE